MNHERIVPDMIIVPKSLKGIGLQVAFSDPHKAPAGARCPLQGPRVVFRIRAAGGRGAGGAEGGGRGAA